MPAYVGVDVDVKEAVAFQDYVRNVPAIIRKHGGEYLAVNDAAKVVEGSWQPHRLVWYAFQT